MFTPRTLEVAMVSFEGPDEYSQAGGLGVRAREMCRALAALGYNTTLFFIGDPLRPAVEMQAGVRLVRCCQDTSRRFPTGVYDGEPEKVAELTASVPDRLIEIVVRPAIQRGKTVAILCEEWQTAELCMAVNQRLRELGLRQHCVLLWNANNHFGFDAIEWQELSSAAGVTSVSRYMKHLMWPYGVNPVVIPNGIPGGSLRAVDQTAVRDLRVAAGTPCFAFKIGRFSADKRWHQALASIAELRRESVPARLLMRGGPEPFGKDVIDFAYAIGLTVHNWDQRIASVDDVCRALRDSNGAAIVNLMQFLPGEVLPEISVAATAVVANSGHEPFGLVGLEAMAAGAVAIVGATGEEYARPYGNAIVIETDDAAEVASALRGLVERPALARRLRQAARRDAADFVWPKVIEGLLERLRFLCMQQDIPLPVDSQRPVIQIPA